MDFTGETLGKSADKPSALTCSFDFARVTSPVVLNKQRSLSRMLLQGDVDLAAAFGKGIFEGVRNGLIRNETEKYRFFAPQGATADGAI